MGIANQIKKPHWAAEAIFSDSFGGVDAPMVNGQAQIIP